MKKRNIASLMAVAAVATSIGASNATAYKGAVNDSKNNVLLSNSSGETAKEYAVVINGDNSLVLKSDINNNSISSYVSVGEMLIIKAKIGDYYEVTVQETGATGYISSKNVELVESGVNDTLQSLNEVGTVINVTSKVRIREKATMNSSILEYLNNGTKLNIIGKKGEWYEVNYNGKVGFVYEEYINPNSVVNNVEKTSTSTNKKLLTNYNSETNINNYLGNYNVSSVLGPSYSYGAENPVIGHSFIMNKDLFTMENIPGSNNYNIKNPSYEIKEQSVAQFKSNYGYDPSEIGLTGNTLTELVVAGNNSAENNSYSLSSFGSNNEMIFYIQNGNLILFEPTTNFAYICEGASSYANGIASFNNSVKNNNNVNYSINTTNYKENSSFSNAETALYNRILNIVKSKVWTESTNNQRTMTMDMGTTYNKNGVSYYSVYLYSINSSNSVAITHYYISTNGDILAGNSFEQTDNTTLTYNERKNIISKIAMEYINQGTVNPIYSFNCNLNKSIVKNGVRYYQVNVWSNNPLYPGGQSIKESDTIYVSVYGNVINTYNKSIVSNLNTTAVKVNTTAQSSQSINGITKRNKKG